MHARSPAAAPGCIRCRRSSTPWWSAAGVHTSGIRVVAGHVAHGYMFGFKLPYPPFRYPDPGEDSQNNIAKDEVYCEQPKG